MVVEDHVRRILVFKGPCLSDPSFQYRPTSVLRGDPFHVIQLFRAVGEAIPFSPDASRTDLCGLGRVLVLFGRELRLFHVTGSIFRYEADDHPPRGLNFVDGARSHFLTWKPWFIGRGARYPGVLSYRLFSSYSHRVRMNLGR